MSLWSAIVAPVFADDLTPRQLVEDAVEKIQEEQDKILYGIDKELPIKREEIKIANETKRLEKEAMFMTDDEKSRLNDEYLKGSNVYAGQDPIQIELIEEAKKERLREIEKQNNAHLVSDEKLIETAKRVEEEKAERFAAAQAEAKANAEKLNAELRQERLERDVKENAESTPLGQRQNERLDDIKSQENLKSNAKTTPLGQSVLVRENQKKASLATQLKQKEIELYQNQINNLVLKQKDFQNQLGKTYDAYLKTDVEKSVPWVARWRHKGQLARPCRPHGPKRVPKGCQKTPM